MPNTIQYGRHIDVIRNTRFVTYICAKHFEAVEAYKDCKLMGYTDLRMEETPTGKVGITVWMVQGRKPK